LRTHPHEDETTQSSRVSTGSLPSGVLVREAMKQAHERYRSLDYGRLANYIPALSAVRANLFGLSVVSVHGVVFSEGDAKSAFTIQSVAKPFVLALVCQALGTEEIRAKVGVNGTGMGFDSVLAIELNPQRTMNPMVNAGAIATTSLAPGVNAADKWRFIHDGLSRFAGRALALNQAIYHSEAAANQRNRGIAQLLQSYDRMYFDAAEATDIYTKQCSLDVTTEDLAVMAATLADGGINPLTRERVVDAAICKRVLAVLAIAGMYERSGDWLYDIGLPGKSGVSGGIITIAPGKGGMGCFAPLLDEAGNSIKGQLATKFLSEQLGLNLFVSKAVQSPR
jgi:glutaminase